MRQDRWFVRAQGFSLGPLTTQQVKQRLFMGEIQAEDKGTRSHTWKPLAEQPEFRDFIREISAKSSDQIVLPPSPANLRHKKLAPLPIAITEVIPQAPALAPSPQIVSLEEEKLPAHENSVTLATTQNATEEKAPAITALPAQIPPRAELSPAPSTLGSVEKEAEPLQAEEVLDLFLALHKEEKKKARTQEPLERKKEEPAQPVEKSSTPVFLQEREIFIADPVGLPPVASKKELRHNPVRIEINLSNKQIIFTFAFLIIASLGITAVWVATNKTRDLKSFTSSDPPSPTAIPSEVSDPISPLKAPTRPKRD